MRLHQRLVKMSNPFKDWTPEMVKSHNSKILSSQLAKERTHEHFGGQGDKGLHAPSRKTLASRQGLTPDSPAKKRKPSYTAEQVIKWCEQHGLPRPVFEHRFHPVRKWRMDIAFWNDADKDGVAIEVQGGLWIRGGHNRGAQMKSDWEKLHEAQKLGWKMIYCEPKDLLTTETAQLVKDLLNC